MEVGTVSGDMSEVSGFGGCCPVWVDLLSRIVQSLDGKTVAKASCVSQLWRRVCSAPSLWAQISRREFGVDATAGSPVPDDAGPKCNKSLYAKMLGKKTSKWVGYAYDPITNVSDVYSFEMVPSCNYSLAPNAVFETELLAPLCRATKGYLPTSVGLSKFLPRCVQYFMPLLDMGNSPGTFMQCRDAMFTCTWPTLNNSMSRVHAVFTKPDDSMAHVEWGILFSEIELMQGLVHVPTHYIGRIRGTIAFGFFLCGGDVGPGLCLGDQTAPLGYFCMSMLECITPSVPLICALQGTGMLNCRSSDDHLELEGYRFSKIGHVGFEIKKVDSEGECMEVEVSIDLFRRPFALAMKRDKALGVFRGTCNLAMHGEFGIHDGSLEFEFICRFSGVTKSSGVVCIFKTNDGNFHMWPRIYGVFAADSV